MEALQQSPDAGAEAAAPALVPAAEASPLSAAISQAAFVRVMDAEALRMESPPQPAQLQPSPPPRAVSPDSCIRTDSASFDGMETAASTPLKGLRGVLRKFGSGTSGVPPASGAAAGATPGESQCSNCCSPINTSAGVTRWLRQQPSSTSA